jgi:hypothetical protein
MYFHFHFLQNKIFPHFKQHYFFPYLRQGHQFDHVSRGVQERRFNKIISFFLYCGTLMSDCLYFFPIYFRDGKKQLEWSLKWTSP